MKKMITITLFATLANIGWANELETLRNSSELKNISMESIPQTEIKIHEMDNANREYTTKRIESIQTAYLSGIYIGTTLIIDGKKVRVDDELPKGLKCGNDNGIEIICAKRIIQKVIIRSQAAYLTRSFITVKRGTPEEIIRFYGKPDHVEFTIDKLILKYPSIGVDFELDKTTERITKITVYIPIVTIPKPRPQDFQMTRPLK